MGYILVSVLIGICISIMISINGTLSVFAGPLLSLLIIYTTGLITSSALMPVTHRKLNQSGERPPFFYFITGSLGLLIVLLNNATFNTGGVILVLSGMLAGQTLVAFLFDLLKKEQGRILPDSAALILIALGVTAVGIAYRIPLTHILLSLIPGILLMLQILMNASLASYYGDMKTLQINYGTGFLVILIVVLSKGILPHPLFQFLLDIPVIYLIGGGLLGVLCMGAQNLLVRRMSALALVLSTYSGEFSAGLFIDAVRGKEFSLIQGIGLLLVIGGLIIRSIPSKATEAVE